MRRSGSWPMGGVVVALGLCAPLLRGISRGGEVDRLAAVCPGAAAWNAAHEKDLPMAMEQRDQGRQFTDPALRQELQTRFERDQTLRRELLSSPHDPVVAQRVDRLDDENVEWLRKWVAQHGLPTAEQVGESGLHWTWLLVQHADRDPRFQAAVAPLFAKRYEAGELPGDDLAKLTDRILLAAGKPQRFGTQFDWLSGHFNPRGTLQLTDIEANRAKFGLMPLTDYACMMTLKVKNGGRRGEHDAR